jgi:hypothetical protein
MAGRAPGLRRGSDGQTTPLSERPTAPATAWSIGRVPSSLLTIAPLLAALLLWLAAIPAIDPDGMTDLGLIAVLPPAFYVALGFLVAGFCLALGREGGNRWTPAAHVAAWIVIVHGTPALVYGSLRYAWAWKHVGIVDYIQRTGAIDPAIDALPIYHNWPGFFGAAALLTEAAGFADALPLATWSPVFFEILFAAALLLVLRAATPDRRLAWLGVWFFTLTNWVGQDYFSPQAMTYALYLVVIGLCLWAFPARMPLHQTPIGRFAIHGAQPRRLAADLDRGAERSREAASGLPAPSVPRQRELLVMTLALLAAIAVSHPLTPIVTILALFALVLLGQCRVWWLPLIMLLFTGGWMATGASSFAAEGIREVISTLGRANENVDSNLIDASLFTPGFRIVSNAARALTAGVGLLAALGWLRRFRGGYLDLPLTLLWLVPIALLGMSSYGGEILFRVYFFALPFMAFYLAALFAPRDWRRAAASLAAVAVVSVVLTAGFLVAYYGHEQSNYFRPGEVAAAAYLDEVAPEGALIVEGSPNYPSRYHRYEQFVYVPLVAWPRGNVEESVNAYSLADIEQMMADRAYPATYLIITRSQKAELSVPGLASLEAIQREIEASGAFAVLFQNDAATIYGLADRPEAGS